MIHAPVIWFLKLAGLQADLFPRFLGSSIPGVIIFSLVGITISVLLAMASFHYLELPFLRLKRYLPYECSRKTKQEAVGSVTQSPVSETANDR
jgi:peptidoglycan/LPS O-acetylase OafA/YrhL